MWTYGALRSSGSSVRIELFAGCSLTILFWLSFWTSLYLHRCPRWTRASRCRANTSSFLNGVNFSILVRRTRSKTSATRFLPKWSIWIHPNEHFFDSFGQLLVILFWKSPVMRNGKPNAVFANTLVSQILVSHFVYFEHQLQPFSEQRKLEIQSVRI